MIWVSSQTCRQRDATVASPGRVGDLTPFP